MTVFDRHYETWQKREGLADTLADRVFEIAEQVLVSKRDLKYQQIEAWKIWTEVLAKSHSKKALEYLDGFLNDNRSLGMEHRKNSQEISLTKTLSVCFKSGRYGNRCIFLTQSVVV
ncbi:MAG: hypothetical protein R2784_06950 [Saprospiraceae bacterium]